MVKKELSEVKTLGIALNPKELEKLGGNPKDVRGDVPDESPSGASASLE